MNEVQLFPSITSFNSSATSIYVNESISLSWQSTNTSSCTASGDWSGNKNINGSETLTLTEIRNHTFTLSCNGNNNNVNSTISVDVVESSDDIYEIDKEIFKQRLDELTSFSLEPGFWDDNQKAQAILRQRSGVESQLNLVGKVESELAEAADAARAALSKQRPDL